MLINDFEAPVVKRFPEIAGILQQLYKSGAVYAALSGSGSTVYGIYSKGPLNRPKFPEHYFTAVIN
jgi:4-diphosphocytidyl-2-C-methyl-D-erythritol kinase